MPERPNDNRRAQCDINNVSNGGLDFGIVGGTSASSPTFTGIMALVNQYQAKNGGTNRQGDANYVLYALAKKAAAGVFNDVTKGNSALRLGEWAWGQTACHAKAGHTRC